MAKDSIERLVKFILNNIMADFDTTDDGRLYLQMMQDNITRMATNSANAKTWLVTIVAAFLAIGCNIRDFDYWLLLAIAPICVFWYLDAFYLNIERGLRNREQRFINICKGINLDGEVATKEDAIFVFKTLNIKQDNKRLGYVKTGCMFFNGSVWPVYVIMLVIVVIITAVTNDWFSLCCCMCK